jgi:uncharacterized protein (DUF488 family)
MRTLFTIGYEGASLEDFVATLQVARVQHLVDVREVAQSRRRGFSKNALAGALAEAGISYTHMRQLGDPKAGREAARRGDIEEFRRIFEGHLQLPETKNALAAASQICQREATVLMCFERNPQLCHRTLVAKCLTDLCSLSVRNLGVVHHAGERFRPVAEAA